MARITPQQRQRYGPFLTGSIPAEVLGAIDDIELDDRLTQASALIAKSAKAATPGAGRQSGEQARRILAARPRAETEQIVVAKMAKAKMLGNLPRRRTWSGRPGRNCCRTRLRCGSEAFRSRRRRRRRRRTRTS